MNYSTNMYEQAVKQAKISQSSPCKKIEKGLINHTKEQMYAVQELKTYTYINKTAEK